MRPHLALAMLPLLACTTDESPSPPGGAPRPTDQPLAHPPRPEAWSVDGFATPESVVWDERTDLYLVSNINGSAHDADDNGFISRVSPPPDPRIVDLAWIDGGDRDVTLHGPKGLALAGDLLYVVDIGALRRFDRATGEPRGMVDLPGMFVNDVVADGETLYVSVTGLDRSLVMRGEPSIWAVDGGAARKVVAGDALGGPNGLAILDGELTVVSFASGELYRLEGGARTAGERLPAGTLDGIVALPDGRVAVTSWAAAGVFVGRDGSWRLEPWRLPTPADLGFDARRRLLLVPSFAENRIEMHAVSPR
jgi:sugar lactone lactonase YvrE